MSGLSIVINAGANQGSSSVHVSGSLTRIVTDNDRQIFGIQDSALKSAVHKLIGASPDDAFVCSPTPWGDLYKTYNWSQLQTVLQVTGGRIVSFSSNPEIVSKNTFSNNSGVKGTFQAGATTSVTNTVENNWSNTYGFSVSQAINYGVNLAGLTVGGTTTIGFTSTFAQGGSHSNSVAVGANQSISVELEPGQSVVANLSATRGTMTVEVDYEAHLTGSTAVNYNHGYKGHHYWDFSISSVMQAAGISNSRKISETIQVGYFANATTSLDKH